MEIPIPPSENKNIYDYGFDAGLNRAIPDNSTGVVYDTIENALNTGSVLSGGNLNLKTLSIGGLVRQVAPGDDIQAAIDAVSREGGGTVQLLAKRYTVSAPLSLKSRVVVAGAGVGNTVLDIGQTGSEFNVFGTVKTNVGSDITATKNSAQITGTSTEFTQASPGDSIQIRGVWYEIKSVTNNTTLTLQNTYTDNTFTQPDVKIADTCKDAGFCDLTITGGGINAQECERLVFQSVISEGLQLDSISNSIFNNVVSHKDADFGYILVDVCATLFSNCGATGNGNGFDINNNAFFNIPSSFVQCIAQGNTLKGFNGQNLEKYSFLGCTSSDNGSNGMEFTSTQQVAIVGCTMRGNGAYGLLLTSMNESQIIGNSFDTNTSGGYHIVSGSDNLFLGNSHQASFELTSNTSVTIDDGNYNYIYDNRIPVTQQQRMTKMQNTSGGTLDTGAVVVFKSVASGTEITTTTTNGDAKVLGMATSKLGSFSNNSYGDILTEGKTSELYVSNGTASISIGDFLSTYSHAYYAKKASAGETAFAIALEAPTTSTAAIDALLISPRMI